MSYSQYRYRVEQWSGVGASAECPWSDRLDHTADRGQAYEWADHWTLNIGTPDHYWSTVIDTETGEVIYRTDI